MNADRVGRKTVVWQAVILFAAVTVAGAVFADEIPVNITCDNALTIEADTVISGDNANALSSPFPGYSYLYPLWYRFTVSQSLYYHFEGTCQDTNNTLLFFISTDCGEPIQNIRHSFDIYLESGVEYTLAVGPTSSQWFSSVWDAFTFSYTLVTPPENNHCAGATAYTLEDGTIELALRGATWDGAAAACGAGWDVWCSFTPQETDVYRISVKNWNTYYSIFLALYDACGGAILEDKCYSPSQESPEVPWIRDIRIERLLEAGRTYAIAVAGVEEMTGTCQFSIVAAPEGDNCGGAASFTIPGSVTGSTYDADPYYYYYGRFSPDVWYTVTPDVTGTYEFSLEAETGYSYSDFEMAIYTDCRRTANISSEFQYNDEKILSAPLEAGITYYLEVGDDEGLFTINATLAEVNPLAPPNDDCADAAPVSLDAPVTGTNANANDSLGMEYGCTREVWYSFQPAISGQYRATVTDAVGTTAFIGVFVECGGKALAYGENAVAYPLDAGNTYRFAVASVVQEDPALDFQFQLALVPEDEIYFSGGTGAPGNPYLIATSDDLSYLSHHQAQFLESCFSMTADIDMEGVEDFVPIGTSGENGFADSFKGSFDGGGHEIAHLRAVSDLRSVGLFGYTRGARLSDIHLRDCAVESISDEYGYNGAAGGIVGTLYEGMVSDCRVSGTISNADTGSGGVAGGIVGCCDYIIYGYGVAECIQRCYSSATVSGQYYSGGIVGQLNFPNSSYHEYYASITRCGASGLVFSGCYAGGIAGSVSNAIIAESYFSGRICRAYHAGGIVGDIYSVEIEHCLSAGQIDAVNNEGMDTSASLVGRIEDGGNYFNAYYGNFSSPELNGVSVAIWPDMSPLPKPFPLEELLTSANYALYSLDFDTPVWQMTEGVTVPRLAGISPGWGETCTLEIGIIGEGVLKDTTPGIYEYRYGQPAVLEIAQEALNTFSHWSAGDGFQGDESREARIVFIMERNRAINAVFVADNVLPVATLDDLEKIGNQPEFPMDWRYRLTADIDASTSRNWNNGAGFAPIGNSNHPFGGVFDGDGHVIENLFINRPNEQEVGLFGCIAAAAGIYNLGITGCVAGGVTTGGIAALSKGTIANCFSNCAISGTEGAGGIVGASNGIIRECWSGGNIRSGFCGGGIAAAFFGDSGDCISSAWLTSKEVNSYSRSFAGGVMGILEPYYPNYTGDTFYNFLSLYYSNFYPLNAAISTGLLSGYPEQSRYGCAGGYSEWILEMEPIPFYDASVTGPDSVLYPDLGRGTAQLTDPATFAAWDFTTPLWTMTPGRTYPHLARTGPQAPQTLTLAVSPGGAVTVSTFDNGGYTLAAPPYAFEPGTPLLLEAVPEPGYRFEGWAGIPVLTGHNETALQVTLVYNATVSATFVPEATPTPYVQIAEAIQTGGGEKDGLGSAFLWGVVSPDVTAVRINGASLALDSILCAETIYSTYTLSHTSGMRKWTWLGDALHYGGNDFTVEADAETPEGTVTVDATRTVTVADTDPPVVTLLGDGAIPVECGDVFDDPGATAMDNADGDLFAAIVAAGAVDTLVPGVYEIVYSVTDTSGNAATPVTRSVTVQDTTPPEITLEGDADMTLLCRAAYVEPGATATDACGGDLSEAVVSGGDTVTTEVPGAYTVTYNVSDAAGNAAAQRVRTVHVTDGDPPALLLEGAAEMTIECGGNFAEPGFAAHDGCANDLTGAVAVTNLPDTASPGDYAMVYTVVDTSGRTAQAQRLVHVLDTVPPSLALLGAPEVMLRVGTAYIEPGYTASDVCAGDLGGQVDVAGLDALTTAAEGDYTLTYTVADPSGNTAEPLERLVYVKTVQTISETLYADLDAADSDDDGQLTYEEALVAMPGLDQATFDVLDVNGDDRLDEEELNSAEENDSGCCCFGGKKSLENLLGDLFMMVLGMGTLLLLARRY